MAKKLYMVESLSTFHMRYLVEADSKEEANKIVKESIEDSDCCLSEFSQRHLGEEILSVYKIKEKAAIKQFRKDNDYLAKWEDERIAGFMVANKASNLFGEKE